jgi:hypothetical protein
MFKAEGSIIEAQHEKGMAVKTVDRAFLQGQILNYLGLQSKVKQHSTHMKEG